MWTVYAIVIYFALALLIPVCWALIPVWRRARIARQVDCPALAAPALVHLDPWYAARRRTFGGDELRIRDCSQWPDRRQCRRECLQQLHSPV